MLGSWTFRGYMWIRELGEQMPTVSPCSSAPWSSLSLPSFMLLGKALGLILLHCEQGTRPRGKLQLLLLWPALLFFHLMHTTALLFCCWSRCCGSCAGTGSSPLWAGPSSKLGWSNSQGAWRCWSVCNSIETNWRGATLFYTHLT